MTTGTADICRLTAIYKYRSTAGETEPDAIAEIPDIALALGICYEREKE